MLINLVRTYQIVPHLFESSEEPGKYNIPSCINSFEMLTSLFYFPSGLVTIIGK